MPLDKDFNENIEQREVSDFVTNLPAITEEQRLKNQEVNRQYGELNPEDLQGIFGNEMKRIHGLPDWHYREIPWITDELFAELLDTIDRDNIRVISGSKRSVTRNGETVSTVRASVLISPEGMERLNASKECE